MQSFSLALVQSHRVGIAFLLSVKLRINDRQGKLAHLSRNEDALASRALAQTAIIQPSGTNNHACSNFGSVCARYTAYGGATKRLVTITCVSASVLRVILLIAFLLSCVVRWWPELRRAGRSFSRGLFAASQAIGPALQ